MEKIVIWLNDLNMPCFSVNPGQIQKLKQVFPAASVEVCRDRKTFSDHLPDMTTAIVWSFEREWIPQASKLKRVITPAAGKDFLNWPENSDVEIIHGGFHGKFMAETVLGMMLSHSRGIAAGIDASFTHPWPRSYLAARMRLFAGSRVTIAGFGRIGKMIGEKASALGARITGITKTPHENPPWFSASDNQYTFSEDWREVLPETDHFVMCLPSDPEIKDLIGLEVFAHLPKHGAVYNVGRGTCLDEAALTTALREGLIAAAYLDVFKEEPLPATSVLRDLDNCYVFPHVSAVAPDYLDAFIEELSIKLNNSPR